ncbi:MAG: SDR family NAD(P)-dependent oxidoreductase [Desulfobacteraceae bacterium]|nr:SDR family NAD(P)-dependent oxidoreductase [Desulfobacteraceae bacterium]
MKSTQELIQEPVAIIGIGCMFARSKDLKSFTRLLMRGKSGITNPPSSRADLKEYLDADPEKPDHICNNRGGYLPPVLFDPTEFSIPPNVLEATDTSQLLGLMAAKKALEDAGYGGDNGKAFDRSKTSIMLGITGTQELVIPLGARLGHPIWRRALDEAGVPKEQSDTVIKNISDSYVGWQENSFPGLLGNVVAGRIANRLNLGGTNCVVDAACASSMGAINSALLELITGRSDMVITGGVDTINDVFMHMCFSKTHILSQNGEIQPFSKNADGTLLGEGIGLVVLKRLADAEKNGDRIYAVIKGLGSASDGKTPGIYAPSSKGQASAMKKAYAHAGICPSTVRLIEAHGTGTRVGDQVEFEGLCSVFNDSCASKNQCALGTVKSNIGHAKAAAGAAGLIKTTLALYHKVMPPTLNAQPADPNLNLDKSPFYLNNTLRPWVADEQHPRRAGVSSFGFGGSNFHAVVEEYQNVKQEPAWEGAVEIAAFSSNDKAGLLNAVHKWRKLAETKTDFEALSRLAAQTRKAYQPEDNCRLVMVLSSDEHMDSILSRFSDADSIVNQSSCEPFRSGRAIYYGQGAQSSGLAFLFPGQGSQYVGMGRDMVCCFPESLEALNRAQAIMKEHMPITDQIYPGTLSDGPEQEARLRQTDVAQPAIGIASVAMLKALEFFGLQADATCGHSYGELVALYAAGWISQADLWTISQARGKLIAQACSSKRTDPGTMLAVKAPVDMLENFIEKSGCQVLLANRNSYQQGIVSGSTQAILEIEKACHDRGWKTIRLPVAAAFHSSFVADARQPFKKVVEAVAMNPGSIKVMSNTSGDFYPCTDHQAKEILCKQLAAPVDFLSNVEQLYLHGCRTFVEIGPKTVLTHLVSDILKEKPHHAIALDRSWGKNYGLYDLALALSELAAIGYPVQLQRWEKTQTQERKVKMAITLSGANYRNPKPVTKQNARKKNAPMPPVTVNSKASIQKKEQSIIASHAIGTMALNSVSIDSASELNKPEAAQSTLTQKALPHTRTQLNQKTMKSSDKKTLATSISVLQQGLASLQALQSQTAQAHQKFLEAQSQASKTLHHLIQHAHQGSGLTDQLDLSEEQSAHPALAAVEPMAVENVKAPSYPVEAKPEEPAKRAPEPFRPRLAAKAQAQAGTPQSGGQANTEDIHQAVLEIVSQLTGYPSDMLSMEMDIESDLGIDSIKRVEILSALEEKMPHLPKITPDLMGSLKTLAQISDYLSNGHPSGSGSGSQAQSGGQANTEDIHQAVLEIVSQLTGYPSDMLSMEMDIESDLGIDSIKRVEILSALEEKMPHLPKITPDLMGSLKTLAQISGYLAGSGNQPGTDTVSEPEALPQHVQPSDTVLRSIVKVRSAPLHEHKQLQPSDDHFIGVTLSGKGLSEAIVAELTKANLRAGIVASYKDLDKLTHLTGLILIAPVTPQDALLWAKAAEPLLKDAVSQTKPEPFFSSITFFDGAFGFKGGPVADPRQGALTGLIKTAALEWEDISCMALDIDPGWQDTTAIANAVVSELIHMSPETPAEIGLTEGKRWTLHQEQAALQTTGDITLGKHDVVVVTGGARGVTSAAASYLALQTGCRLALLGRSAAPSDEPEWLNALEDQTQIKKAILENHFGGKVDSLKQIDERYRIIKANRDTARCLEALSRDNIQAGYYSADVRCAEDLQTVFGKIRNDLGPIKGLIHGAGVLEDCLITEKQPEQLERVLDTKVKGLENLLFAAADDQLNYLVLFSSISARLGNAGQADYAMANEILNKMARDQAAKRPECKTLALNWGPWDGGMVTSSLKLSFTKRGVSLIPIQGGSRAMAEEMANTAPDADIEVVLGGPAVPDVNAGFDEQPAGTDKSLTDLNIAAKRNIDLDRVPILESHRLDGHPVVPFALIAEWLAHSALHANPGLALHGMDNLRLCKGIVLDSGDKMIRLMAGKAKRNGQIYEVDVEIRNGVMEGREVVHSSARAILTDQLPSAPAFIENGHFKNNGSVPSIDDIYNRILFHGQALRGIKKIIRLSKTGMTAQVSAAPGPDRWMNDPLRSRWIADPLVLDCAFQMAIIWCHDNQGKVSLPSYAASYRQYRDRFPEQEVSAILEIVSVSGHKMVGDFSFLDEQKNVIARLEGYEAIMNENLEKAFENQS